MTQNNPAAHHFDDPDAVATYADRPRKLVPGYDSLLVMTDLLLAEYLSDSGKVFILGAGGGLEMAHFARNHPDWRFFGVDPSAPMLALAEKTMGPLAHRASLFCGYAAESPTGPYDAATSLMTLHFVPAPDRLATLCAVRSRLKPGAPFISAHHSVPGDAEERILWFTRFAAFAQHSGVPHQNARAAAEKILAELPILSPEEDEALLIAAGFGKVRQFYTGLTFHGWISEAV